ncbi:fungal-specific transcription factor domain-containing protein [Elsinoe ampelina]|uniref:Fungal-specific transcription factor domain-containing protein n=1 Tax=Elsinoe ampelina TaxID=302913 RepID=A0A6A6GAL6_9PEZI|nr:fungal-specific transcription factor domain-containing protein [Elsinoe ampelina]
MSSAQTDKVTKQKRSRKGCAFCKEKRLKCDETKPQCKNCTSRDRTCPGYAPVLKWRTTEWQPETGSLSSKIGKQGRPRQGVSQATPRTPRQSNSVSPEIHHATLVGHAATAATAVSGEGLPMSSTTLRSGSKASSPADIVQWQPTSTSAPEALGIPLPSQNEPASQLPVDLDGLDVQRLLAENVAEPLSPDSPYSQLTDPMADFDTAGPFSGGSTWMSDALMAPVSSDLASLPNLMPIAGHAFFQDGRGNQVKRKDVRKLLTQFYTTHPKLSYPLFHQGTKLVEHYFTKICALYSCFDSFLNPFRSIVGQQWSNSASTYYAIQSMAAAHLANELPFMKREGMELHRQASEHLGKELVNLQASKSMDDQPLLTLLLLGMSACWQRPGDLGLPFLRTARSFLRSNVRKKNSAVSRPLLQMFEEALIYWEMVTSFVASDSDIDILQAEKLSQMEQLDDPEGDRIGPSHDPAVFNNSTIVPHPWTGVSLVSQILLGQVGKVIYAVRTQHVLAKNRPDYVNIALNLEESLLALALPESSSMVNCGDGSTSPVDFITLAEITRDAGLLELYRVFPVLLQRRLPQETINSPLNFFDVTASAASSDNSRWLTSLALHILKQIKSIPASSHVRVHQLLPIIIAACELRFPTRSRDTTMSMTFTEEDTEIYQARKFARERLHQLAGQLPAQPIHTMLQLITEVWQRLDTSSDEDAENSFWIDVMVEKGWYTLMG